MNIEVGDVVIATAGKEKNQFLVVQKLEGNFCFLVDGGRLKISKPKKKNLKHVQKASKEKFDSKLLQSSAENVNSAVRKFLKEIKLSSKT